MVRLLSSPVKSYSGTSPKFNFQPDQRLRFLLDANPTKKEPGRGKSRDRLGLFDRSDQIAWLKRKGEAGGFQIDDSTLLVEPLGFQRSNKADSPQIRLTHYGVRFKGILTVSDSWQFADTCRQGIGSAKAFGFGLLSLAHAV